MAKVVHFDSAASQRGDGWLLMVVVLLVNITEVVERILGVVVKGGVAAAFVIEAFPSGFFKLATGSSSDGDGSWSKHGRWWLTDNDWYLHSDSLKCGNSNNSKLDAEEMVNFLLGFVESEEGDVWVWIFFNWVCKAVG